MFPVRPAYRAILPVSWRDPDQVHLTATTHGIGPAAAGGGELVWTLPLVDRPPDGARQLRHGADAARQGVGE